MIVTWGANFYTSSKFYYLQFRWNPLKYFSFQLEFFTFFVILYQSFISFIDNCFPAHSINFIWLFTSLQKFNWLNFHGNHSYSGKTVWRICAGDPLYFSTKAEPPTLVISYFFSIFEISWKFPPFLLFCTNHSFHLFLTLFPPIP